MVLFDLSVITTKWANHSTTTKNVGLIQQEAKLSDTILNVPTTAATMVDLEKETYSRTIIIIIMQVYQ